MATTLVSASEAPSADSSCRSKECLYCKTANTPLWRMGPDGCKTLCNACGIRWRRVVSRSEKPQAKLQLVPVSAEMSPESVLAGASDDEEPSWDEISEVAAKLTRLAGNAADSDSRKRKRRGGSSKANKRQEINLELFLERVETLCQEQEATDAQLEVLNAQILRQNNERIAMANMVGQLHKQLAYMEGALQERDEKIEELQASVQLKSRIIAGIAAQQGGWQV